jgi:hypothetical protein
MNPILPKRHRLHGLSIAEISIVTIPAVPGATIGLAKSASPPDGLTGIAKAGALSAMLLDADPSTWEALMCAAADAAAADPEIAAMAKQGDAKMVTAAIAKALEPSQFPESTRTRFAVATAPVVALLAGKT